MTTRTEDDYKFLPFDEAASPAGGGHFFHYTDCYWVVHPERGLAFFNPPGRNGRRRSHGLGAAQCNTDPRSREFAARMGYPWPAEVRLIVSAWVPVNISDYRRD